MKYITLLILILTNQIAHTNDINKYNNIEIIIDIFTNRNMSKHNSPTLFSESDPEGKGLVGWFIPQEKVLSLIIMLSNEYKNTNNETILDNRDIEIVATLKRNLNDLYLHIPKLEFNKKYSWLYSDTAIYTITGWNTIKIDDKNIDKFFTLFLAGAHFVIVGDNTLLADVAALPNSAKNYKHSHYQQTEERLVYPAITWKTKNPAPIVTALLIDVVKNSADDTIGTFFQLEGWPVHKKSDYINDTYYHAVDYFNHINTLWNVSTYGMSPYSEKRGTSIFITKTPEPPPMSLTTTTFKSNYHKYAVDKRQ